AQRIDIRLCCATNVDLRVLVADGKFRSDLYYRLNEVHVRLPPLRDRPEEIPWHVARSLASVDRKMTAGVRFVEACILRPWPGNVRELVREVRRAGREALLARSSVVNPEHLANDAGIAFEKREDVQLEPAPAEDDRERKDITETLRRHEGNL